jgi:hypothetical protein
MRACTIPVPGCNVKLAEDVLVVTLQFPKEVLLLTPSIPPFCELFEGLAIS